MEYDWSDYLNRYADVATWLKDARQKGLFTTGGDYTKEYGANTTGWEENWLNKAKERYGRDEATDLGDFSEDELAQLHYETWNEKGNRTVNPLSVPRGQSNKDDYFDTDKFESLLSRLEASKGRQQRQKSIEGRRDIYATGLAGMMGNF